MKNEQKISVGLWKRLQRFLQHDIQDKLIGTKLYPKTLIYKRFFSLFELSLRFFLQRLQEEQL
jgi:hypothetical protein